MGRKQLNIYFTSDLHGYMYPTDYKDPEEKNIGLFKCASRFQKDGNTLVIDGGDILQGSAFAAFCHDSLGSGQPIAEIMNRCRYDYVTLGNHDFNYGTAYLETYLHTLNAQCVCQNIRGADGVIRYPYQLRTMESGLRVGIVGIVTDHVNIWEKPEHIADISITDPFTAAREALEALRGMCDFTVCIYHGGFERDIETGRLLSSSTENIAYRLCSELDFDLLLTGHQHMTVTGRMLHGTYVVQSTDRGEEYQHIQVTVDGAEKQITGQTIPAGGRCNPSLLEEFANEERGAQLWLEEFVGHLEYALLPASRVEMAAKGSCIANLLNQVQLDCSGAQLSAVSLANEIAGFPQIVRRRDILTTYPYTNTLVVLQVTGTILRQAIERSAEYFDVDEKGALTVSDRFLKPKIEHYNYDYFAGISYVIDVSQPIGSRVTKLTRHGKSVRDEDVFTICMNNYRSSGAGGYSVYQQCPVIQEINTEMVDLIMAYFEKTPKIECSSRPPFQVIL
ncbi:bifunctional UDP-sugar hydrolase/5'-nucleotidase [Oscillospiraceae bacterium PP1C4]